MGQEQHERRIKLADPQETVAILGRNDEHLKIIREHFSGRLLARGDEIVISGQRPDVETLYKLFNELLFLYREGNPVTSHDVGYSIRMLKEGREENLHLMFADTVMVTVRGRHIKPKTLGQPTLSGDYPPKSYHLSGLGRPAPEKLIWLWLWPFVP